VRQGRYVSSDILGGFSVKLRYGILTTEYLKYLPGTSGLASTSLDTTVHKGILKMISIQAVQLLLLLRGLVFHGAGASPD
jgi:hypothetical protein